MQHLIREVQIYFPDDGESEDDAIAFNCDDIEEAVKQEWRERNDDHCYDPQRVKARYEGEPWRTFTVRAEPDVIYHCREIK